LEFGGSSFEKVRPGKEEEKGGAKAIKGRKQHKKAVVLKMGPDGKGEKKRIEAEKAGLNTQRGGKGANRDDRLKNENRA